MTVIYRYDHLIANYSAPKLKSDPVCAIGLQISLEKVLIALAAFQAVSVKTLFKEQKSFGFWSPRRCDVYVVSYQPGYLNDRLEVAALLWRNNISADIMYESGLPDREHENHYDLCNREGILYVIVLFSAIIVVTANLATGSQCGRVLVVCAEISLLSELKVF